MASETIKIPGIGPTKRSTAYALGGVAVLVLAVAWYRSRGAASSSSGSSSGAPAATADINPATGYPSGSAEDQAALAAQSAAVYPGGGGGGVSGPNYNPTTTTTGYTTNAQWAQAVEDYLVTTVGGHADVVGNALGKYLTGSPVTEDQAQVIMQAIAFGGYPPANGPTGYPPSYRTAPATPTPAPSGSPGAKLAKPGGLHTTAVNRTSVTLSWTAVKGAIGYRVYQRGFAATVGEAYGTSQVIHNLQPNHAYSWYVAPLGTDGRQGPSSATVTAKTKK